MRVGTVVTVQLTPDTTSEDGPVRSADRNVLPVVSWTSGAHGQSQTVLRAVAPGQTDLVGPDVIQHCSPTGDPPCEGARAVDWDALITVNS